MKEPRTRSMCPSRPQRGLVNIDLPLRARRAQVLPPAPVSCLPPSTVAAPAIFTSGADMEFPVLRHLSSLETFFSFVRGIRMSSGCRQSGFRSTAKCVESESALEIQNETSFPSPAPPLSCRYYIGFRPTLMVSDLGILSQILIKDFPAFANRAVS
ncbi:hypothetical protein C7M84_003916 [Penaeus vannamei]|uniref:Uncharacterized protein n=1 Tax=Penaeus vannamei TaxID=6689 RepID=A0A3R7PNA4_PENVA|nr:hypothetical protein C7M84_003916 [Penaeus vannamei]